MAYDSRPDTEAHIREVQRRLARVLSELSGRSFLHDKSKLEEPEKSLFDKYTPLLRDTTYGSDQYKKYLEEMGSALNHHYEKNSHHPEHYLKPAGPEIERIRKHVEGMSFHDPARDWLLSYLRERESRINGMSLLDVVEMLADWKAAGMRHKDGNLMESLEINRKRFGISDQLFSILINTVKELEW
jgi:hypothetical protein